MRLVLNHSAEVLVAGSLAVLVSASAAAQPYIDVSADQRVTVVGSARSLRDLVKDLCYRAGVDLLSYDAPDRPVTLNIEEMALPEAFQRLLRRESYFLRLRPGIAQTKPVVIGIRVLGDNETARASRAAAQSEPEVWRVPPDLVRSAFAVDDPVQQRQALEILVSRIAADKRQLAAFLSTDAVLIAETLGRYPRATELLSDVLSAQTQPAIREKIAKVIDILAAD